MFFALTAAVILENILTTSKALFSPFSLMILNLEKKYGTNIISKVGMNLLELELDMFWILEEKKPKKWIHSIQERPLFYLLHFPKGHFLAWSTHVIDRNVTIWPWSLRYSNPKYLRPIPGPTFGNRISVNFRPAVLFISRTSSQSLI